MHQDLSHIINYQSIADIKHFIQDPSRKSKLLCINWSENVDLYETHQEKSHYYSSISASIKAVAWNSQRLSNKNVNNMLQYQYWKVIRKSWIWCRGTELVTHGFELALLNFISSF